MQAYITDTSSFLPNDPVDNEAMEPILGMVLEIPSRTRKLILRNNGIRNRYYAIDPRTHALTHTNAQLAAEAVRRLKSSPSFSPADIECLCCGTSSPDQTMPGHASMVHGELGQAPCETVSMAGICVSGMAALKYAVLNVLSGQARNAVATGSETASTYMRSSFHANRAVSRTVEIESDPTLAFESDFLRWMLSDGAGAVVVEPEPRPDALCLRVEWIEMVSFAHELEPCMYAGAVKRPDGSLQGWREFDSLAEAAQAGAFSVKQDVRLLNRQVIRATVERALERAAARRALRPDQVDWFLPHYSSLYFRQRVFDGLERIGFSIPYEKWFTNLETKGNTGSAAMYIMLDEFRRSGFIERGQRVLCFIPESGRFSSAFVYLTAV
jgi:3-oxoacyl-[acyl-carrier-protein] synthase-3